MKRSIEKPKTAAIIIVLLMASVMVLFNVQVNAQLSTTQEVSGPLPAGVTPNGIIRNQAFLSFAPMTVGVGQAILVNAWIAPSPGTDRMLLDYKITITKPDGTTDVVTTHSEPDTGAAWFNYVPDQVGTWTLKLDSPGTYMPAGRYNSGFIVTGTTGTLYTGSSYYPASSTPVRTLTVQNEMIASWPPSPLPNDYWTRPVQVQNREWLPILGDYPWKGPAVFDTVWPDGTSKFWNSKQDFTPYVQGPNTAHIAWKRQGGIAGIEGAGRYGESGAGIAGGYYEYPVPARTMSYNIPTLPMIIAGRGYQLNTAVVNGVSTTVFECYDIRTGEQLWQVYPVQTGISSSVRDFGNWVYTGSIEYSGGSPTIVFITNGQLLKYNPSTGALTGNYSLTVGTSGGGTANPITSGTYYMNGYALSVQSLGTSVPENQRYRLINWTTLGTSSNFATRIVSNISYAISGLGTGQDFELGVAVNSGSGWPGTTGTLPGLNMVGVSLKTGLVLWNKTFADLVSYATVSSMVDHGKFALLTDQGSFNAYNVLTGNLEWTSTQMDSPWDAAGFGAYETTSAYGLIYRCAYSGVYAFNWTNGQEVWKYENPNNPFETPYTGRNGTVSSFNGQAIVADGKMYVMNTEHSPTQPITRGWDINCINATTGEFIWKIATPGEPGAIADGYLSVSNPYDGYQYMFGKGKSATTVAAPDVVMPQGNGIVIKGTVLDMSPAQPNTPAVSKESMTTQMEYLHLQYPIGGLWNNETITGVPVTLTAIDSSGAVIDIGTVTTNGYYGTFSKAWTPPNEGTYTITASFAGDDSYGSSSAATAVAVSAAASPYPTPQPPQAVPDNTPMFIGSTVAIIIAVAIVGLLIFQALRKRP